MSTNRNYGIDLLRIVSMVMICMLHLMTHGGVLDGDPEFSLRFEIKWFFEIAALCAVNCYALISGFVGINAKHKYSNIIRLWFQVVFYTVLITVLFALFMPGTVGIKTIVKAFIPVIGNQYWYFTAYFCMFFFIPFFNYIVNTMDKRNLKILLITLVALFSILQIPRSSGMFYINNGYSPLWLSVLYLIGAYAGKYGIFTKLSKTKLFLLYLLGLVLTFLSINGIGVFNKLTGTSFISTYLLARYVTPTVLLEAVALLLLFSKIKINKSAKIISFIAPLTFGVYLIHDMKLVQTNIIGGGFITGAMIPTAALPFAIIGLPILIFAVCAVIEAGRYYLFKLIKVNEFSVFLDKKISKIVNRVFALDKD